ncbi:hypothetical protein ACFYS8_34250 [Kitasatospora sp. NPDC004615]|uniref:hypothetical protein n=1 Tax=Kitasatospora sp. NPDC004615 TaxID=3364017 RepID=UPI0036C2C739
MPQQREQFAHGADQADPKPERKRLDLTVTQVAASALATVVGAVLASELGVYGTILGAAVVSVGATTGSAVFQHLFKRTAERLRNRGAESGPGADPRPAPAGGISGDWNEPQLVRAKRRWTWKSYTAVSALVFVIAMVPIVSVELATGKPLHDITTGKDGSGTSFNPSRPTGGSGNSDKTGTDGDGSRGKEGWQQPAPTQPPSREPSSPGPSDLPSSGTSGSPAPSASPRPSTKPEPSASPSAGSSPAATGEASPGPAAGHDTVPGAEKTG